MPMFAAPIIPAHDTGGAGSGSSLARLQQHSGTILPFTIPVAGSAPNALLHKRISRHFDRGNVRLIFSHICGLTETKSYAIVTTITGFKPRFFSTTFQLATRQEQKSLKAAAKIIRVPAQKPHSPSSFSDIVPCGITMNLVLLRSVGGCHRHSHSNNERIEPV